MASFDNKPSKTEGFFQIVQRNWMPILGILVFLVIGLPWLIRRLKEQVQAGGQQNIDLAIKQSNAENKQADPLIMQSKEYEAIKPWNSLFHDNAQKLRLMADTKALVRHFGYHEMISGSIFGIKIQLPLDPSSWTENDEPIGVILRRWSKFYPAMRNLYYQVYTDSQNLDEHVLKWLDNDELEKTRKHWKQYGLTWL